MILAPLAVGPQTIKEGEKFGIEVRQTQEGKVYNGINITNYERIDNYNPDDFAGIVLDESSILKNFDGKTRKKLNDFGNCVKYRLLCSATPAPNDFTELGTSSEILGDMKYNQMLAMFFSHCGDYTSQWTIKGHAKKRYWQWVSTWARAVRKPSDLGYSDKKFKLPKLDMVNHIVKSKALGRHLFPMNAITLQDERVERKATLKQRCEKVKRTIPDDQPYLVWCNYNDESTLLTSIIKDAVEVRGSDKDSVKVQRLTDFTNGKIRVLVTKPRIAGWGLNWQHCSNMSFFPTHSYEQFYQAVRRCWRFGQKNDVVCNLVSSQSQGRIRSNMINKELRAKEMFDGIIKEMADFQNNVKTKQKEKQSKVRIPEWL